MAPKWKWPDIKHHNYIVAHGKVYDAETFALDYPEHPSCIKDKYGTDCSSDFDHHRMEGKRFWEKYKVGILSK